CLRASCNRPAVDLSVSCRLPSVPILLFRWSFTQSFLHPPGHIVTGFSEAQRTYHSPHCGFETTFGPLLKCSNVGITPGSGPAAREEPESEVLRVVLGVVEPIRTQLPGSQGSARPVHSLPGRRQTRFAQVTFPVPRCI